MQNDFRLPSPEEESRYLNPSAAVPKYFHFATVICERFCSSPVGTVLPALTELASRFNVSKETINRSMRYLASRGYVKSERGRGTRIVKDLSEALGLPGGTQPKAQAAAAIRPSATQPIPHASGQPKTVGVVLLSSRQGGASLVSNIAEIEFLGGLQHRLFEEGISLTTLVIEPNGDFTLDRQLAANPSIGGLVFLTDVLSREEAERVARMRCPAVVVNNEEFSDILTCIVASEAEGVESLVRHLYQLGHRKLLYVVGWSEEKKLPRYRGFEMAMRLPELAGIQGDFFSFDLSHGGKDVISATAEKTKEILAKYPDVTAYITGSSEVPQGICRGLRKLGLTPGKEISVASFGLGLHEWSSVADGHDQLTTVSKPRYEMGCYAADVLMGPLRQKYEQTGLIRVPTALFEGTTTGPAPV